MKKERENDSQKRHHGDVRVAVGSYVEAGNNVVVSKKTRCMQKRYSEKRCIAVIIDVVYTICCLQSTCLTQVTMQSLPLYPLFFPRR